MNYTGLYFPTKNGVRQSWSELPLRKDSTPDRRYAINKRYKGVTFKVVNGEPIRPSKRKLKVEVNQAKTEPTAKQILGLFSLIFILSVIAELIR